jgi:hypothetical protein
MGSQDEIMDSIKTSVGTEIEAELLKATWGEGSAVWGGNRVCLEVC